MLKKKYIPAHNCIFHLAKGRLAVHPTLDFTPLDLIKTYRMAILHAKWKKIKRPSKINDFVNCVITIPTLPA